jgi:hypothetical protein
MSTKVVTGKVLLSYLNVAKPVGVNGGEPKYSVSVIIPKSDTKTLNKIKAAIEEAKKEGTAKLGKKIPANLKTPLRDGDIDRPDDEAYADSYFILHQEPVQIPAGFLQVFFSGFMLKAGEVFNYIAYKVAFKLLPR